MQEEGVKSPFLNRVREVIRTRHYSIRTEQSYTQWVKRYILFHNKRHPNELGEAEVAAFLSYLAVKRRCRPARRIRHSMRWCLSTAMYWIDRWGISSAPYAPSGLIACLSS